MAQPPELRAESVPPRLVVVRLGVNSLGDEALRRSTAVCHQRWGFWGFSVLEVPGGDFAELARRRPIVADRRHLLVAEGDALANDGFPLLPTLDSPHWTLVLSDSTFEQYERVRGHFRGPLENPTYRSNRY